MRFWRLYRMDSDTSYRDWLRPGKYGMRSIQRLLTAGSSFLHLLENVAVSIWCPDCGSDQIHRSRTRGTIESLWPSY